MPVYRVSKFTLKTGIVILVLAFLASCSLLRDRKKDQFIPVSFDLGQEIGPFNGLGANVPISFYSRRMKALQTCNELGIKYLRVKREDENWNDILALRSATSRLGIKWIYSLDAPPPSFVDNYGKLVDVKGFAGWWAEEVDELLYQDVPADFIELLEVPDITRGDSLPFTADVYNDLLHATREELDLRDFQNVAIVGPGLSHPGIAGDRETWYMALDQVSFDMLSNWTVQVWEDSGDSGDLGASLGELINYLKETDSFKPIFVTSYATSQTVFNQIQYPDPAKYDEIGNLNTFKTFYYSATFTMPYALRMYSNTLDLLKNEDVIPFLYQLYDAPAEVKYEKKSWGLLDLSGGAKPVFTLLSTLMKRVPQKATLIQPSLLHEKSLNGMIFSNASSIVITLSNEATESKSIQVNLSGAKRKLEYLSGVSCYSPEIFPPELGQRDQVEMLEEEIKLRADNANGSQVFSLLMKPQSIFVGEFKYK